MRTRRFPLKWLLFAVLAGIALYYGAGLSGRGGAASATAGYGGAVPVSVAAVVVKPVTQWAEFSGIFEAVHAAEIRPRIGGQITAIHFADGAQVKKGAPLFTIDPRPYEAELLRAKGALASAQSAATNAATEYARAAKLVKSKAISQSEFEGRASAARQTQGALDSARGALKVAEVNLSYTRIAAPISGKISRAEITVGNQVEAGASAPLLASIVTLSPLYASFDIDEHTYLKTIRGVSAAKLRSIPVEVGLGNAGDTPIAARIHAFDNQMAPGSGTIRVRALVENTDATLLPGLYARVRIGTPDAVEVALVHPSAIGTDQSKKFVMVVGEGDKATYREVTLGGMAEGLQVIASGLHAGERVIVNGLQRVRPGAPILPASVDMHTLAPLSPPAPAASAATKAP
ncbi:MAG: efflux RND transporter periplasmic adaptor subunit [Alphaproteobacteria bacterium]|nr:efflux RND transporter periplasmic adaptor subunit [Alphaproteobacteria bacterium]